MCVWRDNHDAWCLPGARDAPARPLRDAHARHQHRTARLLQRARARDRVLQLLQANLAQEQQMQSPLRRGLVLPKTEAYYNKALRHGLEPRLFSLAVLR